MGNKMGLDNSGLYSYIIEYEENDFRKIELESPSKGERSIELKKSSKIEQKHV